MLIDLPRVIAINFGGIIEMPQLASIIEEELLLILR